MTRVDLDGEDAADGLIALVVAVIELLVEAMEREAVRRMESGQLSDEQTERLGTRFAEIESEMDRLKRDADVERSVGDLRAQLDDLVDEMVHAADVSEDGRRRPEVSDDG